MEKNVNKFRFWLSNVLEKYDILMLRRNPLVQKLWTSRIHTMSNKRATHYLNTFKNPRELVEFIHTTNPDDRITNILDEDYDATERKTFEPLFEFIGTDIQGKSFFDIGPGHGHSLDLAKERGASATAFVDIDPSFFAYNVLKGHKGFLGDYNKGKSLGVVRPHTYDFIMSRGSLNADQINRSEPGIISFNRFLDLVDEMWTGKGLILINPTFDRGTRPGQYYWCKDPEAFLNTPFSTELLSRGYDHTFIETFNHPHYHPFTFVKRPA